jgi:hypothetical protein
MHDVDTPNYPMLSDEVYKLNLFSFSTSCGEFTKRDFNEYYKLALPEKQYKK